MTTTHATADTDADALVSVIQRTVEEMRRRGLSGLARETLGGELEDLVLEAGHARMRASGVTADTSADEAQRIDEDLDGSIAYWRGRARDSCLYANDSPSRERWLAQFDAAATEARSVCLSNKEVLLASRTLRHAMTEGAASLQRVLNGLAKLPPGLKLDVQNSRRMLEQAIGMMSVAPGDAPLANPARGGRLPDRESPGAIKASGSGGPDAHGC